MTGKRPPILSLVHACKVNHSEQFLLSTLRDFFKFIYKCSFYILYIHFYAVFIYSYIHFYADKIIPCMLLGFENYFYIHQCIWSLSSYF